MDGIGRRQPLTDSQLDRELEDALGVDPAPDFLARVRTRIASEPDPALWRLAIVSALRRTSVEPLWAVAIVGIVLAIVVPQFMRENDASSRARAPQMAASFPRAIEGAVPPEMERRTIVRHRVEAPAGVELATTLPLQLSRVLFAEDERRAFEFFVAAAGEGRVPEEAVEDMPAQPREVHALSIAPLEIAPLPLLARVAPEGESPWE